MLSFTFLVLNFTFLLLNFTLNLKKKPLNFTAESVLWQKFSEILRILAEILIKKMAGGASAEVGAAVITRVFHK